MAALGVAVIIISGVLTLLVADSIPALRGSRQIYQLYFDTFVTVLLVLLAFTLFIVSLLAYAKEKRGKLAYVAVAFFLFSVRAAFELLDLVIGARRFLIDAVGHVLDFGILLALFLAVLRKE